MDLFKVTTYESEEDFNESREGIKTAAKAGLLGLAVCLGASYGLAHACLVFVKSSSVPNMHVATSPCAAGSGKATATAAKMSMTTAEQAKLATLKKETAVAIKKIQKANDVYDAKQAVQATQICNGLSTWIGAIIGNVYAICGSNKYKKYTCSRDHDSDSEDIKFLNQQETS